jgi:holdfast attachment protein HfaA
MRRTALALAIAASALSGAQPALANPMGAIDLKAGYGRRAGDENRPVQIPGPDAQGNRIILNGLLATGSGLGGGLFGGAGDARDIQGGLGVRSAPAVANQINVVAQGSGNTIIIEAMQYNSGDISSKVR